MISTTLATSVHLMLLGQAAMFHMGPTDFDIPRGLPSYLLLGVLCGVMAIGFTKSLYWVEDQFKRLPVRVFWHPAIGALGLGIIGYFVPRVFGIGYDTISDILNNALTWTFLLLLAICKSLALMISLGSGTSGGLLAPMFMASAALGGVFANFVNHVIPAANLSPAAFALVAMGAVFGAAARAAFAFIVFSFEITRDYNAVLPLMLVSVIADAVAIRFLPNSIMTEKLARRGIHVDQEYEALVLKEVDVQKIMTRQILTAAPNETVRAAADLLTSGAARHQNHEALPIVDSEGRLIGIVTQGDLLRAMEEDPTGKSAVLKAGTLSLVVAYPDESAFSALTKMLASNIGRLPVVERTDPKKMVGYLNRAMVMSCWERILREESLRETGWLGRLRADGRLTPWANQTLVGNVLEIGENQLKLRVQGSIEEFALAEPVPGISVGDRVRVRIHEEGGHRVTHRVEKLASH